ncbi:MAG TPA: NAD(P)/FAD-dependent oxidoreductase [Acidimicrobiales bacterium]|nr:NAD(P)/FAD-dependent oxidoreductase [Acidimicrobiales bacterium]
MAVLDDVAGLDGVIAPEAAAAAPGGAPVEEVDVLVVGAGISGIGAAHHLRAERPGTTFLVVDALDGHGGTWRTHRYPGARSDSDLFTFGYRWKPWKGAPLATAEAIRTYLAEAIDDDGLADRIRYRHTVQAASWSSDEGRWTVQVLDQAAGTTVVVRARFLWMCQGYYRHDRPYTPDWPGLADFRGPVVHPQRWPDDLDLAGKRVVVIGSGATAATLIPAIAATAAHVTMLQRSPTFFIVRPNVNELAETLRELDVPDEWVHEIVRRKIVKEGAAIHRMAADEPEALRAWLLDTMRAHLPDGFEVERHFNPTYRPWQQRIAVLLGDDLFAGIRDGSVSVVTDTIDRFTPDGIVLGTGATLDADVVITATGFDLSVFGEVPLCVDGAPVDPATLVTYRGIMFTGLPNLAWVFGYFRASWTLRADLISDFVLRLLDRLDATGARWVVPELRPGDHGMALGPWVDPEEFNPGYLTRSMHRMPRQGDRDPWRLEHEYIVERDALPAADLDDGLRWH